MGTPIFRAVLQDKDACFEENEGNLFNKINGRVHSGTFDNSISQTIDRPLTIHKLEILNLIAKTLHP